MIKTSRLMRCSLFLVLLAFSASQAACIPAGGAITPVSVPEGAQSSPEAGPTLSIVYSTTQAAPSIENTPAREMGTTPAPTTLAPQTKPTLLLLLPTTQAVRKVCDKAAPGSPIDVTIADNTRLSPGQGFTKIWRLVNIGDCRWTRKYSAEWFSGEKLGDTLVVSLDGEVPPGDSLDIAVDMVAPLTPGTYQGNWKLRNAAKEWFGIGPDGEQVFWVRIEVVQVYTDTPAPTATEVSPSITPTPTLEPTFTPTITPTLTLTPTVVSGVQAAGSAAMVNVDQIDLDSFRMNAGGEDLSFGG